MRQSQRIICGYQTKLLTKLRIEGHSKTFLQEKPVQSLILYLSGAEYCTAVY